MIKGMPLFTHCLNLYEANVLVPQRQFFSLNLIQQDHSPVDADMSVSNEWNSTEFDSTSPLEHPVRILGITTH